MDAGALKGMFDLSARVALITGGNRGIGFGIASGLGQHGARVILAARDTEKTAEAVEQLKGLDIDAFGLEVDIQNEQSIAGSMARASEVHGRIDILVNNAGINRVNVADQFTADDWRNIIDTNLTGAYLMCKAVYPHMSASGGGKIINIASMTATFGSKRSLPYGASKGGLIQMTRSLALAWAGDNIQVNAISPGWVETEMTQGLRASEDPQIQEIHRGITGRIPAGRWARPDDMAGAAVFLASAASDYVTGAVLTVDGGYSAA